MGFTIVKTLLSAIIITMISEIAKRSPAFAALIASLPLVSVLGMIWIYNETNDIPRFLTSAPNPTRSWSISPTTRSNTRSRAPKPTTPRGCA